MAARLIFNKSGRFSFVCKVKLCKIKLNGNFGFWGVILKAFDVIELGLLKVFNKGSINFIIS